MEVGKIEGVEDEETTKEKGRRFATPAGIPVQDLEGATSCPVIARGDRIGGFHSGEMDEDQAYMPMETPSDQDEEGVLQQASRPTPLRGETVDDDDEANEMPAPKRRETSKIKRKKKKY